MRKFLIASLLLLSAFSPVRPSGIYGVDNRLDMYEVNDPGIRELASATAAMFPNKKLQENADGSVTIQWQPLGKSLNLCSDQRFWSQPDSADCSSTLIGPDLVLTAGHCMSSNECNDYSFIFGYEMKSPNQFLQTRPRRDVYHCKQVVDWEHGQGVDYSIVRLDRPVEGRKPVELSDKDAEKDDGVFVIGYPSGLPVKYADGARVRSVENGYFVANLDTFAGNSGSAVFSAATRKVVGILVRGGADYVTDSARQCLKVYTCPDDECRGEDSTSISFVKKYLPRN